ncbi:thioesterase family protein [Mesorhizobium sp. 2RAF21]|uniref:thioesterase family protein n=1 Tax=Mesorhizobium sp. 2RAF21 TaxID=3232995 RepID=UPI003F94AD60
MFVPTPYVSPPVTISPDWCNAAGELTKAFCGVVFDKCSDGAFELVGLGPDYVRERNLTFFTAESHVCYVRPVHSGDQVVVHFRLLDYDEKRIRSYQEMYHVVGWLAATSEILSLHVDLSGPKVSPFPQDITPKLSAMADSHASLPLPERAGRNIELARSLPAAVDQMFDPGV